ncbi:hypothetical protein RC98_13565 [Pectobacterium carotovorum subsp. carotovorum]|uniref:hypothetical protein n=1 Tax=Pectobacterium carotovorum TaxID=554 RepID=UPI00058028BC|nr:hypothetical protein [Pectobacterium carotovorum]KHT26726.1 hypothetical protein RC98_13565 [Pectobacterium carotovorum subsp. carotovorum]
MYTTLDALKQELHRQGHSVIYERTTEYPVVKGVGQFPPAKHLLTPDGKVVGIFVEPMGGWRRRESDDCVRDEPAIEDNPFAVKHDVNAPLKTIRRL